MINSKMNIIVYRVTLTTGQVREHRYEVPNTAPESLKFVDFMVKLMSSALNRKVYYLPLQHPSIVYNAQHIVAIDTEVLGEDEFKKKMQEAQERAGRKLGFTPPEKGR